MSLSARAIALAGIGAGARLVALDGLWQAGQVIAGITGVWRLLSGEYPKPRKRYEPEAPPWPSDFPPPPPLERPAIAPAPVPEELTYGEILGGALEDLVAPPPIDEHELALSILLAPGAELQVERRALVTDPVIAVQLARTSFAPRPPDPRSPIGAPLERAIARLAKLRIAPRAVSVRLEEDA